MKALVVYDSVFGNTEKVAQAMGAALGAEVVQVGLLTAEHLKGVELLVVGSPTRAFQPTRPMQEWLKSLAGKSLHGVKSAVFDTRVNVSEVNSKVLSVMVRLFGYAAEPMAKKLQQKGAIQGAAPAGFFVIDKEGPLKDGELERAAAWASALVPGANLN